MPAYRGFSLFGLGTLLAVQLGCGGGPLDVKTAPVKGQLTQGGQPYKVHRPDNKPLPPGDTGIRVRFVRADPGNSEAFLASVDPNTGTFTVPGANGKGLPPGKYTATVYAGALGEPSSKGGPPNPFGTEIAKKEIDVPDAGLPDLVIEVEAKK